MIEIDGALGEGGGQILRSGVTLSLLTGKAFRLFNVRAGRDKPGLQPQHLMSVRAAAEIGQAQTRGAAKGSMDLTFEPGKVLPGKYRFPIGTAGATGLVLHTVYLPLALCDSASELTLEGGTHVKASPCFHFLDATWRSYLNLMGIDVLLRLRRYGFYPRGGGLVEATIQPTKKLRNFRCSERGQVKKITGFSAAAGLPLEIAHRQARRAASRLQQAGHRADIKEVEWEGGPGTVLALTLDVAPAPLLVFGLGERGKPAERVADEAVEQMLAYLEAAPAAVDPHGADQIVLPLAFAEGPSEFTVSEVTKHLITNVAVIRRFVEREIVCEGEEGKPGRVRIE